MFEYGTFVLGCVFLLKKTLICVYLHEELKSAIMTRVTHYCSTTLWPRRHWPEHCFINTSFYYHPIIPEVWYSIDTSIEKSFEKNNQKITENLETTFGKSCISKIKQRLHQCQLLKENMNIGIPKACSLTSDAEKD